MMRDVFALPLVASPSDAWACALKFTAQVAASAASVALVGALALVPKAIVTTSALVHTNHTTFASRDNCTGSSDRQFDVLDAALGDDAGRPHPWVVANAALYACFFVAAFYPAMCTLLVALFGARQVWRPIVWVGVPTIAAIITIRALTALRPDLFDDQPSMYGAFGGGAIAIAGTIAVFAASGRRVEEPQLTVLGLVLGLVGGASVLLFAFVLFPLFYSTDSLGIRLLLRVVAHTAVKKVLLSVTLHTAKGLKKARPETLPVVLVPIVVLLSFSGRFMQVASSDVLYVVASEVGVFVLEFSTAYSFLSRRQSFALPRMLRAVAKGSVPSSRQTPQALFIIADKSVSEPDALSLGPAARQESRARARAVVSSSQHERTSHGLVSMAPEDSIYGTTMTLFCIAEAATTVLATLYCLFANINVRDPCGSPPSLASTLRSGAIVLAFELGADFFVAYFAVRFRTRLGLVDLLGCWRSRPTSLKWVVMFCVVAVGSFTTNIAFDPLCVVTVAGRTQLSTCARTDLG